MIMTVSELRQFIQTDEEDQVLEAKLQALELQIKSHTNNNFQKVLESSGDWPMDIKIGVVNLLKWELNNRDKAGVASESISRHSVTYFNMSEGNSIMGFPATLVDFLKPYKRARFGRGIG